MTTEIVPEKPVSVPRNGVAVIVTRPAATAVTIPVAVTVAIDGSEVFHLIAHPGEGVVGPDDPDTLDMVA